MEASERAREVLAATPHEPKCAILAGRPACTCDRALKAIEAARNAALEESAGVAANLEPPYVMAPYEGCDRNGWDCAQEEMAKAILALKAKG